MVLALSALFFLFIVRTVFLCFLVGLFIVCTVHVLPLGRKKFLLFFIVFGGYCAATAGEGSATAE